MSRVLVIVTSLALSACVTGKKYEYQPTGPTNASLVYKGRTEIPFVKVVALNVFKAKACDWEGLGYIEVKSSEQKFAIPADAFLQIDAHFGSFSALGPYSTHSQTFYRFNTHKGDQYLFEVNDSGRSFGFQVYRLKPNGEREEVKYVSLSADCRS